MKILAASLLCLIAPFVVAAQNSAPAAPSQKTSSPSKTTPSSSTPQTKTSPADSASKADSKIDPAKEAAIRKLLETQGIAQVAQQMLANMFNNMRPTLNSMLPPGEYREKLTDLFFQKVQSKFRVEEMVDSYVSLYDQYFSKEDIEGMTKFYQTPLGQKMLSAQPKIVVASQAKWTERGQTLGREAMMEVFVEHPELQKAMEEAAAAQQK